MKRLVNTKGLPREEWLEWRRKGIGGSDSASILGISPYRSVVEIWKDKLGASQVRESESEFTHFGTVLEDVVRKEFELRTGLRVRKNNFLLQSDDYPFMIADLDGVIRNEDGSCSIFEAKTASAYKKEEWETGVPDEYYCQIQHYMAVTGYKSTYICALVGGNSFYIHFVERDEAYIRNMIEKEREFWDCVVNKRRPAVDGSDATTAYLNQEYAVSEQKEIILPSDADKIIKDYNWIEAQIKVLGEKKTECANKLKAMLEEAEVGRTENHTVTWKTVTRRGLDTDKVKEFLGDTSEYIKETTYRKLSVA